MLRTSVDKRGGIEMKITRNEMDGIVAVMIKASKDIRPDLTEDNIH